MDERKRREVKRIHDKGVRGQNSESGERKKALILNTGSWLHKIVNEEEIWKVIILYNGCESCERAGEV